MIKIEDLSVAFDGAEVVKNVNLELKDGEILGVVGESGSGKSVTALTLMGLVADTAEITSGRIVFDDVILREAGKPLDRALYRKYQGAEMSMVFQEPMTSLNPTQRVGRQVEELLRLHTDFTGEEIRIKVLETFEAVGLKNAETIYASYPHQLSGGMRQRVMIAMAVILHPDLVVCDEPTTALDVTIQNQIIELLRVINEKEKNSMLFITHDLNLARRICHRVAVMKDGRVVELGRTEDIFEHPQETYTRELIEAVPSRLKRRVSVFRQKYREASKAAGFEQSGALCAGQEGECLEQAEAQYSEQRGERQEQEDAGETVLEVRDLSVYYQDGSNSLFSREKRHAAVKGAKFTVYRGESLGPQMIFQDPYSSLNPAKTIGWLLQEPLRAAGMLDQSLRLSKADMEAAAYDMLHRVGMEEKYFHRKPNQLSGGQRQRVSIGQALITNPGLVVADEPVSALDVTIQAQIMELMQKLQQEMQLSYLFISHDINVVYKMCDRIMVMKEGKIIEIGETEEIFAHPKQEYTRELLGEQK